MSEKLPYMFSVGLIRKIFEKMQDARRPERFTQDFLATKLGHSGGSARPFIPLLKRMGFLGPDGIPTELYNKFRNEETRKIAIAQGMKNSFGELFDRNEYVYELERNQLTSMVVEITGETKNNSTTKAIVGTFWALRELADFDTPTPSQKPVEDGEIPKPDESIQMALPVGGVRPSVGAEDSVGLHVGYTINLNLPETNDPEVFNAIFKSLRENLLKN